VVPFVGGEDGNGFSLCGPVPLWTGAAVVAAAVTVAVEGNRTMSMMWTMPLLAAMSALVTLADGTCVRYGQFDGGTVEGLFDGGAVEGPR